MTKFQTLLCKASDKDQVLTVIRPAWCVWEMEDGQLCARYRGKLYPVQGHAYSAHIVIQKEG